MCLFSCSFFFPFCERVLACWAFWGKWNDRRDGLIDAFFFLSLVESMVRLN